MNFISWTVFWVRYYSAYFNIELKCPRQNTNRTTNTQCIFHSALILLFPHADLFHSRTPQYQCVQCALCIDTVYTIVQLTHFSALKCNDNIRLGHYRSHFEHYGIVFETKMKTKQETRHKTQKLSVSSSSSQARLHLNTIPVFMFRIYVFDIGAKIYLQWWRIHRVAWILAMPNQRHQRRTNENKN